MLSCHSMVIKSIFCYRFCNSRGRNSKLTSHFPLLPIKGINMSVVTALKFDDDGFTCCSLASQSADMTASVPELQNNHFDIAIAGRISSANSFSLRVGAPKKITIRNSLLQFLRVLRDDCDQNEWSPTAAKINELIPSASTIWHPSPFSRNKGVPPTERNALTGEFTPPENNSVLFEQSFWLWSFHDLFCRYYQFNSILLTLAC